MTTKQTSLTDDDALMPDTSGDLDQAIGDLRGVLKASSEGGLNDFGDFGDDLSGFGATTPGQPASAAAIGSGLSDNLDLIMDIPIDVQIVLGTSRMLVSGLMGLEEGATITLDRKIGEPVDIIVNGRRIARGEITVLQDDDTRFGVKLIEVMSTRKA